LRYSSKASSSLQDGRWDRGGEENQLTDSGDSSSYRFREKIRLRSTTMPRMTVDPTYCKGCGLCIAACPKKIIRFSENINAKGYHYAECFEQDKCIACKMCYVTCPDVAITVEK
jgi:2-oxoglutarate ferredoxin oxidoreductase subunit delta